MNRPFDSQKPAKGAQQQSKKQSGNAKQAPQAVKPPAQDEEYTLLFVYLVLYNWISAILWLSILGRTLLHAAVEGHEKVYANVGDLLKWTQTLAATEVVHASFGVVRAGFFTTFLQVASRVVLVWLITENFPDETTPSLAYTTMLVAWAATETIRYSYFTGKIAFGEVSGILKWLRYNTFVILYPMGIASEVWLIILATEPAKQRKWLDFPADWHLWALLSAYAPGAWILFTHMMAQRRKVMSGSDKKTK